MTGEPAISSDIPPEPPRPGALERLVRRAQAALVWERVWPQLAAAGSLTLVFVALSWFGLFERLPPWGRATGVAIFGIALFFALNPLVRLARPGRAAALARIDRSSGTRHRLAAALDDRLTFQDDDAVTRALWAAHRSRAVANAGRLRAGEPQPRLAARDPRAMRFLAVLIALVAFVVAGEDRGARLMSAFDWRTPAGGVPPRLDAWVAPPPYTGRAPIFLTASEPGNPERDGAPEAVSRSHTVPAGSVVVVRASGGEVLVTAPGARELAADEKTPAAANAPRSAPGEGVSETRLVLEQDTAVTVEAARTDLAWTFTVVPDAPPAIAFRSPPRPGRNGSLVIDYTASDDYGIASAFAEVVAPPAPSRYGKDAAPPRPLYGPPEIRLVLPQARSGEAVTNLDLVEHPWAGTRVVMTLVARDEPGQEGRSEPLETVLPERGFTHPLARALVEQRRRLALDAGTRPSVLTTLDALSLFPEKFTPELSVYLGLRSAHARLFYARSDDDLRGVVDYLWEIALRLEDGDLSGLERDLKQAEQNLRDALDRGASEEEIAQLMNELREALDKYMQELARRMEQQPSRQAQLPPGAKLLTPQDLKNMLDRMEDLARGGNRDAAQNLLSELRDMLNNLQTAQPGGPMDEGAEAAAKALDDLGRMIREQSELRDRTFRERQPGQGQRGQSQQGQRGQQGQQGEQGQQGQDPAAGQQGGEGEGQPGGLGQLGQEQGALRQQLENMLKELEGLGMEGDPALGEAGEEMGSAEGHLGDGDANRAFNAQGRALDALRRGAQGMAERMMAGQGQGPGQQPGINGRPQQGQGVAEEDVDPLGRPTRARRYDPGSNVRVPGEIEAQRARRVLEELRRRYSDPARPQDELDYLERLLRD